MQYLRDKEFRMIVLISACVAAISAAAGLFLMGRGAYTAAILPPVCVSSAISFSPFSTDTGMPSSANARGSTETVSAMPGQRWVGTPVRWRESVCIKCLAYMM